MRSSTASTTFSPLRLTLLWFGVQLAWGALLGISLQARTSAFNPGHAFDAFRTISVPGALAAAITQLVMGPWSDALRRNGSRRLWFYGAGAIVGAMAVVVFYVAPTFAWLIAAYVAVQISFNIIIGPYQAAIPDFVEGPRIGVASGWTAAMQSGGNAAGAILATLLGNSPILGAAIAVSVLACATGTIAYLRDVPLQPVVKDQRLAMSGSLVNLFVSRAFVYTGFYTLLGYLFFYVSSIVPKGFPLNATMASGVCILLFTVVGAVGAAVAAKPADRLDERVVVSIGGAVVTLGIVAMAVLPTIAVVPVAIVCAGLGWGVFLCADWAFACRVLPNGALASAMAIWNIAVVGPQMLAPLLATAVIAKLGALSSNAGPRDAFLLASSEILIGAAWIWRLPRRSMGK